MAKPYRGRSPRWGTNRTPSRPGARPRPDAESGNSAYRIQTIGGEPPRLRVASVRDGVTTVQWWHPRYPSTSCGRAWSRRIPSPHAPAHGGRRSAARPGGTGHDPWRPPLCSLMTVFPRGTSMSLSTRTGRSSALVGLTALAMSVAAGVAASPALAAQSAAPAASSGSSGPANPYSPAVGHPYRHGVTPTRDQQQKMRTWGRSHSAQQTSTAATGPQTLSYGGGVDGIGVTSGTPKVYLVFWGSQWGT